MKLNRSHSILVFTAIFHLLADVAFAGESVLCVGPNDHAEIEVGHVARDCAPIHDVSVDARVDEVDENDPTLAIGDCSDCVDIPLHAGAEMASEDLAWDLGPAMVVPFAFDFDSLHKRGRNLHIGQGAERTPTMRVHRSIVLIL